MCVHKRVVHKRFYVVLTRDDEVVTLASATSRLIETPEHDGDTNHFHPSRVSLKATPSISQQKLNSYKK